MWKCSSQLCNYVYQRSNNYCLEFKTKISPGFWVCMILKPKLKACT